MTPFEPTPPEPSSTHTTLPQIISFLTCNIPCCKLGAGISQLSSSVTEGYLKCLPLCAHGEGDGPGPWKEQQGQREILCFLLLNLLLNSWFGDKQMPACRNHAAPERGFLLGLCWMKAAPNPCCTTAGAL